jgi:hypothetical protein
MSLLLPDEDSNLDKQNQNLSYYLYTIGQSEEQAAKIGYFKKCSELNLNFRLLFRFNEIKILSPFLNEYIFFMQQ